MYGGAKGGGKTVFGCIWSFTKCIEIIERFKLRPRKYPIVVGYMGRKQAVDFNNTTLNTWKTHVPEACYEIKKQEKLIVVNNTVSILYGGMDDKVTVNKFNSAEFGFYFIDQAEETVENDIALLRGTRRLKINGQELNYVGLLTANPAICWLKEAFIDTPQQGNRFLQALPSDNPFLPDSYVPQLRKAFQYRPELLRAYIEGSWEDLDTANIVIPRRNVNLNVNNAQHDKTVEYRITVADIADEGTDETIIYDMINTRIEKQEIYSHRNTMDTVGRLVSHAKINKSNLICVDKIGVGKGVLDRLNEIYAEDDRMTIYGFDSRVKAIDKVTYYNKRAEAWFYAAEMFAERRCDIPNDPILIKQLSGISWKFHSAGRIILASKDELRPMLGGSPDRGDTYIMGLDALRIAEPYKKPDAYMREEERSYGLTADTC
jgi:phage terminase large subunit